MVKDIATNVINNLTLPLWIKDFSRELRNGLSCNTLVKVINNFLTNASCEETSVME